MTQQFSTTQPVGVAILGLGRWGGHWLRNFGAHPAARVVAVADPLAANLAKVDDVIGAAAANQIYRTTDWQAAIAQPGVEAVVVVTPATTHFELVSTALELGLHVLVEKPLTICPQAAIAAATLAEQQNRILVVDHTYRFNPAVQAGRNCVAAQDLGELRYAYGTRSHLGPVRPDVDVMWDLAIHDLVILNHWLGSSPTAVRAKGLSWLQNGLADTVWATLSYENGFEATMHWSWLNADKQRRLGLVGTQGTLIFDELAAPPLVLQQGQLVRQGRWFEPHDQAHHRLTVPEAEPLTQACQHFLTCIQSNRPSEIASGWQGAAMVQVLDALARSMRADGATIAVEYARRPIYV
jgi:predicted dehydrogenase